MIVPTPLWRKKLPAAQSFNDRFVEEINTAEKNLILGPLGIIFGIVGLRRVNRNPEVKGTGHAVTAIVLGSIGALYNWGFIIVMLIGYWASRR